MGKEVGVERREMSRKTHACFRLLAAAFAIAALVPGAGADTCSDNLLANITAGYNALIHPTSSSGAIQVKVTGTVTKINEFSTKEQTFRLNMYFRHQWVDSRLAWDPEDFCNVTVLENLESRLFWVPDSFFATANEVETPDAEEYVLVRSNGELLWSKRIVLTLFCSMDFKWYPFDDQNCETSVESYAYGPEVMVFVQPAPTDRFSAAIEFLNEKVGTVASYTLDDPVAEVGTLEIGGNKFSRVQYFWHFTRKKGRYIITAFSQLWLVGLMSFVGMYVDYSVAPARVGLALFAVLTMMNLLSRLQADVPVVPYITAMDVMYLFSIFFVVMNVMEYCTLNYTITLIKQKEAKVAELKRRRGLVPKNARRRNCTPADVKLATSECKELFNLYDPARTGEISKEELRSLLQSCAGDRGRTIPDAVLDKELGTLGHTATFGDVIAIVTGNGDIAQSMAMDIESRSAVIVCGRPIVRSTVEKCEQLYRTWALTAYILANLLWFIIVLAQDDKVAIGVSVPAVFLYVTGFAFNVKQMFFADHSRAARANRHPDAVE
eukprot:gene11906-18362_t